MAEIKKEVTSGGGKSVFYDCDICGKEQRRSKQHFLRSDYHFCSVDFRDIYFSGENTHTWNGGIKMLLKNLMYQFQIYQLLKETKLGNIFEGGNQCLKYKSVKSTLEW